MYLNYNLNIKSTLAFATFIFLANIISSEVRESFLLFCDNSFFDDCGNYMLSSGRG